MKRLTPSVLSGSTVTILNTIRANASQEYQSLVPAITQAKEIPKVGDAIFGHPGMPNEFFGALVNRIAWAVVRSAEYRGKYGLFNKGYLESKEVIEDVYVNIAKPMEFNSEKGEAREFKQYIPDVRAAFYVCNYRALYAQSYSTPMTRAAFDTESGVVDMLQKIIGSITDAMAYDDDLLTKYLLIKGITSGQLFPVAVDGSSPHNMAKAFRAYSNLLTFLSPKYNASGVHTHTPRDQQIFIQSAEDNAAFDVDVLASAFNMDRANFIGRLVLMDDWSSFDNERFEIIRQNSDGLEEVTDDELELMKNVRAVLIDEDWFQIYTNYDDMGETPVRSGLYWNYFYHHWKTFASSPFDNAIVFVDDVATLDAPATLTGKITNKLTTPEAVILTVELDDADALYNRQVRFIQNADATQHAIAVTKYGMYTIPVTDAGTKIDVDFLLGSVPFRSTTKISKANDVGDAITFNKVQN